MSIESVWQCYIMAVMVIIGTCTVSSSLEYVQKLVLWMVRIVGIISTTSNIFFQDRALKVIYRGFLNSFLVLYAS